MKRDIISTEKAPKPVGPYSQAVSTDNLVFVSGQLGTDPATGKMVEGIAGQTKQIFSNIKSILETSGSSLEHVLKCGVFLRDIKDFSEMNKIYETFFPNSPPARTTVQAMLAASYLIEIDVIALKK